MNDFMSVWSIHQSIWKFIFTYRVTLANVIDRVWKVTYVGGLVREIDDCLLQKKFGTTGEVWQKIRIFLINSIAFCRSMTSLIDKVFYIPSIVWCIAGQGEIAFFKDNIVMLYCGHLVLENVPIRRKPIARRGSTGRCIRGYLRNFDVRFVQYFK